MAMSQVMAWPVSKRSTNCVTVIVHVNPDDFSQPVGNAGGRVACGVVGIANPKPTGK